MTTGTGLDDIHPEDCQACTAGEPMRHQYEPPTDTDEATGADVMQCSIFGHEPDGTGRCEVCGYPLLRGTGETDDPPGTRCGDCTDGLTAHTGA